MWQSHHRSDSLVALQALNVHLTLDSAKHLLCFAQLTIHTANMPNPLQAVMIAADGSWKLAGFAHAIAGSYASPAPAHSAQYRYDDPFPPVWDELAKVGVLV